MLYQCEFICLVIFPSILYPTRPLLPSVFLLKLFLASLCTLFPKLCDLAFGASNPYQPVRKPWEQCIAPNGHAQHARVDHLPPRLPCRRCDNLGTLLGRYGAHQVGNSRSFSPLPLDCDRSMHSTLCRTLHGNCALRSHQGPRTATHAALYSWQNPDHHPLQTKRSVSDQIKVLVSQLIGRKLRIAVIATPHGNIGGMVKTAPVFHRLISSIKVLSLFNPISLSLLFVTK